MIMLVPVLHIGLAGLAASCSGGVLTPDQIYSYAEGAGFPSDVATEMTAIALRESGGCPTAYYGGSPAGAEPSYGLWQINVKANPSLLTMLGITADQLYDPATNAAAAFLLWGGNSANLQTAWYINTPGTYQQGYLANLPAAEAAAQEVDGGGLTADELSAAGMDPSLANTSIASVDSGSADQVVAFGMTGSELAIGVGLLGLVAVVALS